MEQTDASSAVRVTEKHGPLLEDFTAGRRTALARLITLVENARPGFDGLLDALHPRLGGAHRIGITGPPGAGKSTLTAALIAGLRERGQTVGVVAVDPTSPFTGGALLGDRIRMNDVAGDEGVFIRSMATRGSLGGLAVSTKEVADVMDAFGFDRVIIETVGVGQSELDVAAAADTTVVVLVPESGDSIQAMKAGLMEVSDVFVINKADRQGAERLAREVELMLHLRLGQALRDVPAHHGVDLSEAKVGEGAAEGRAARGANLRVAMKKQAAAEREIAEERGETPEWTVPVLQTVAETAKGVPELLATLDRHLAWLKDSGELSRRRRDRLAQRVRDVVGRELARVAWRERAGEEMLREALPELESGTATPYVVAARIVRESTRSERTSR